MLQRACLEGLATANAGVAFDLPSQAMLAVYKRLRIAPEAVMVRHAKPIRVDRQITGRVPVQAVAQGLSSLANLGLKWRDRLSKQSGCDIAIETGPWGEEFTVIGKNGTRRIGVCVARTAAYLNWRYRTHPQTQYEMLTARQDGELRGYLIQHRDSENCTIDDLLAPDDSTGRDLLAHTTSLAHERIVHTISAPWLSTHPGRQLLEKCGFRARESQQVVLLKFPLSSSAGTGGAWHLSNGDWDN
jgi:hypothetical protein